ncbi:MAG: DnaB-like helicase N-terminal domain-containing protein, partial [Dolichospermum sp.]
MFAKNELDFTSGGYDRLPPQEIEAEEVILGGILLDQEAITRICDRLPAAAFYIDAHKKIYEIMLSLHQENKPTDLLSVASRLTDNGQLASVGGRCKLASLIDRTVSAVNIDALSYLVYEKYLRRELIRISHRNIKLAYATEIELPKILEEAQKSIFDLTQS